MKLLGKGSLWSGDKPSRSGGPGGSKSLDKGGFTAVPKAFVEKDLQAAVNKLSTEVAPWDSTRIILVKPLQDAIRNHGRVLLMKDTSDGDAQVAVKQMPNRWMRLNPSDFASRYPNASEQPWQDIAFVKMLASAGFPYVCKVHGIFRNEKDTFVVTTFCPQGDLFGWCDDPDVPSVGPEREDYMAPIVAQICIGVRWMHDLGISHRDLSLENILLIGKGQEARVKLIDFGMASMERMVKNQLRGKDSYQAPESHSETEMVDTFLSDAFSVGVVMFSMAAHDYPWTCTKKGKCQLFEYVSAFGLRRFFEKRRMRKKKESCLIDVLSPEFVDTLEALLQFEPKHRANLGEFCFEGEVKDKKRKEVFDMAYLEPYAEELRRTMTNATITDGHSVSKSPSAGPSRGNSGFKSLLPK